MKHRALPLAFALVLTASGTPFSHVLPSLPPNHARTEASQLPHTTSYDGTRADDPPPFGTVVEEWDLGVLPFGLTWRDASDEFYFTSQLPYPPVRYRVHKLNPADPAGSVELVPWVLLNLLTDSLDIPWGLVWDEDHDCFWMSQLADYSIFNGCWLVRYVWDDSAWVWGGTPADTWKVGDSLNGGAFRCLWSAGMARDPETGVFYCAPASTTPDSLNHVAAFDPYTKTYYGRLAHGTVLSERGIALLPWDSAYILTCGWNNDSLYKRDSTGAVVDAVHHPRPADWALHVPEARHPDSTAWIFLTLLAPPNPNFQRVSTGMTWRQLGNTAVEEGPGRPAVEDMQTFVPRAQLLARLTHPGVSLYDSSGREIADPSRLPAGAYFVRLYSGGVSVHRKVLVVE